MSVSFKRLVLYGLNWKELFQALSTVHRRTIDRQYAPRSTQIRCLDEVDGVPPQMEWGIVLAGLGRRNDANLNGRMISLLTWSANQ